jgi:hypothetical protein
MRFGVKLLATTGILGVIGGVSYQPVANDLKQRIMAMIELSDVCRSYDLGSTPFMLCKV